MVIVYNKDGYPIMHWGHHLALKLSSEMKAPDVLSMSARFFCAQATKSIGEWLKPF